MKVSAQYAETHLSDLISAADNGEVVEIARPDKPTLKLVVAVSSSSTRKNLLNSARGQIRMADDWDSPKTNKEIEALFENAVLFPERSSE